MILNIFRRNAGRPANAGGVCPSPKRIDRFENSSGSVIKFLFGEILLWKLRFQIYVIRRKLRNQSVTIKELLIEQRELLAKKRDMLPLNNGGPVELAGKSEALDG